MFNNKNALTAMQKKQMIPWYAVVKHRSMTPKQNKKNLKVIGFWNGQRNRPQLSMNSFLPLSLFSFRSSST